jgi:hypothetical protein
VPEKSGFWAKAKEDDKKNSSAIDACFKREYLNQIIK